MATGTGKTVTAMKTICKLFEEEMIDAVVLCASDRLSKQWKRLIKPLPDGTAANWWLEYAFEHTAQKKKEASLGRHQNQRSATVHDVFVSPRIGQRFHRIELRGIELFACR